MILDFLVFQEKLKKDENVGYICKAHFLNLYIAPNILGP